MDLRASKKFKCTHLRLTSILDASPPLLNSASLTAIYERLMPTKWLPNGPDRYAILIVLGFLYNVRDEAGTTTMLDGEALSTCSSRSLYIKIIRPCPPSLRDGG